MKLVKSITTALLSVGIGILPLCPMATAQEDVGTSQADLPNLVARFYIDNPSGKPIKYSVKGEQRQGAKCFTQCRWL